MGCDIHAYAERQDGERWVSVSVKGAFDCRNYGLFAFLAGVRNYSAIAPIAARRDLPADISDRTRKEYEAWSEDAHSASWLSVAELSAFDYDCPMEDRRVMVQTGPNSWNGGATAEAGGGRMTTYREFLGPSFFEDLEKLKAAGAERVVFWFDN